MLVPHVEDTCTHASCLILGDRPLGQTNFILDVVDGVGAEPAGHRGHIRELPIEQVADVYRYVEVGNLAVLGNVDVMWRSVGYAGVGVHSGTTYTAHLGPQAEGFHGEGSALSLISDIIVMFSNRAEYLQGVAGTRDVAVLVNCLDRNQ